MSAGEGLRDEPPEELWPEEGANCAGARPLCPSPRRRAGPIERGGLRVSVAGEGRREIAKRCFHASLSSLAVAWSRSALRPAAYLLARTRPALCHSTTGVLAARQRRGPRADRPRRRRRPPVATASRRQRRVVDPPRSASNAAMGRGSVTRKKALFQPMEARSWKWRTKRDHWPRRRCFSEFFPLSTQVTQRCRIEAAAAGPLRFAGKLCRRSRRRAGLRWPRSILSLPRAALVRNADRRRSTSAHTRTWHQSREERWIGAHHRTIGSSSSPASYADRRRGSGNPNSSGAFDAKVRACGSMSTPPASNLGTHRLTLIPTAAFGGRRAVQHWRRAPRAPSALTRSAKW
jgi:hypothetical protein